jgi:hypothetical protein
MTSSQNSVPQREVRTSVVGARRPLRDSSKGQEAEVFFLVAKLDTVVEGADDVGATLLRDRDKLAARCAGSAGVRNAPR